jgi:phage anti-repressor protein
MSIILKNDDCVDMNNIVDPYIKKAFECGFNNVIAMTIREFIQVVNYPIDAFMVDNFFHNLNDDIPVYVTRELIEWCGFSAKEFKLKKREFKRILGNFKKDVDYWQFSNQEYSKYYTDSRCQNWYPENSANYPNPNEFYGKNTTKHLILTVNCFKEVLMMLNTKKASTIRKYYISLEKLIKTYMKYQLYQQRFKNQILEIANKEHREMIRELRSSNQSLVVSNQNITNTLQEMKEEQEVQTEALDEVVSRLDRATDERAPRTRSTATHGQFLLIELNTPASPWHFYVIRAQRAAARTARANMLRKYPNAIVKLKLDYQPNAVNLFNLIKEELKTQNHVIKVSGNYIKLVNGYTSAQFVADVERINLEKKDVQE